MTTDIHIRLTADQWRAVGDCARRAATSRQAIVRAGVQSLLDTVSLAPVGAADMLLLAALRRVDEIRADIVVLEADAAAGGARP